MKRQGFLWFVVDNTGSRNYDIDSFFPDAFLSSSLAANRYELAWDVHEGWNRGKGGCG